MPFEVGFTRGGAEDVIVAKEVLLHGDKRAWLRQKGVCFASGMGVRCSSKRVNPTC